jgi:pheromone a factor receptor
MAMALVEMLWSVLVTSINLWFACRNGLRPWTGWADVHFNFSHIALFPTIVIPRYDLAWTFVLWWTVPISAVIFFAFFSFGQDAMKEYAVCIGWVRRVVFREKLTPSVSSKGYSSASSRYALPYIFPSSSLTLFVLQFTRCPYIYTYIVPLFTD